MEENSILQKRLDASSTTTDSVSIEHRRDVPKQELKSTSSTPIRSGGDTGASRGTVAVSPMERRRDLLDTLNTIAGIAKALETKLKPS